MRPAEPVAASWKAQLELGFAADGGRSLLARRRHDGPLVVQKPLYPEGPQVCHAIVVHPPGGIAGGDELKLDCTVEPDAYALLTTPGAAKWYRSAGPCAAQRLRFAVDGTLEWLPRETILFSGARASLECHVDLAGGARYFGWEVLCLGRRGAGERFERGELTIENRVRRDRRLLWMERARIAPDDLVMHSPVGLRGHSVCGTLVATADPAIVNQCRRDVPPCVALTALPELLVARYLGDSGEEAMAAFTRVWSLVRPSLFGREAMEPRIWRT